ncbi:MAG: SDR family oxidoreductase [Candidatus Lokiarchaeota archaeon]|nr:SDR family oxidoreductase [Candidatus Lokiarchaeota archaeon]
MSMRNETAVITGATSGIGKKMAEVFLREGCKVVVSSRNPAKVDEVTADFKKQFGENVIGIPCDVADIEQCKALAKKAIDALGTIRILIANAGIEKRYGPFDHVDPDTMAADAAAIIGTNLLGTMHVISAVLPRMVAKGYGRIITLSGAGADRPMPNLTIYSASKGGVVAFSKCLAAEFKEGGKDIAINIFQPGMQRTGLTDAPVLVEGWRDENAFKKEYEVILQYLASNDLADVVRKVIPFVLPSCKANGKLFLGFSLFKLIRNATKLQKALKQMKEGKNNVTTTG